MDAPRQRTAHTLFVDFVGYSRLTANAQAAVQQNLMAMVSATEPMKTLRPQDDIFLRRTGDGLMLVFFDDSTAPFVVALELDASIRRQHNALRETIGAPFRLRMGIHRGPVVMVEEGGELDVAGEGVNLAQRLMDAGDADHILATADAVAPLLANGFWAPLLHELGNFRVKHDVLVHAYNVYGSRPDGLPLGNEALPPRLKESQDAALRLLERDEELTREDKREFWKSLAGRSVLVLMIPLALAIMIGLRNVVTDYGESAKKIRAAAAIKRAEKERQRQRALTPVGEASPVGVSASPAPDVSPGASPLTPASPAAGRTVPSLIGLSVADADAKLAPLGLKTAVNERNAAAAHPSIPAGGIVAQTPEAGSVSGADGAVYVTLSLGPMGDLSNPASNAPTGVVVDARGYPGFRPRPDTVLCGPDGSPLYGNLSAVRSDDDALRGAGANPVRMNASGMSTNGGLLVAAPDVERLRTLPADVRARTIVVY